jgi:hypothetical protein
MYYCNYIFICLKLIEYTGLKMQRKHSNSNGTKIIFLKNHTKCNTISMVQVVFIVFDKNVDI